MKDLGTIWRALELFVPITMGFVHTLLDAEIILHHAQRAGHCPDSIFQQTEASRTGCNVEPHPLLHVELS